jgi:type I restriction enzyme S subunit
MSEWKEYKLGELVQTNKKSINSDYPFEEIEYLDTGSITRGKIESFQKYKLSEAPSRAKRLVVQDDIIYSTVRPIQRHYGFIDNPLSNLVVSTGFATITCEKDKLNPKFLYYLLSNDDTVEYLDVIAEASTSAYPSLRPSDIENLEITIPELPEQKAIASILSSLDDKIDLLHRQNATLEKMGETLFRQWFVEEAKADWEEISLYDAIELVGGGTPKTIVNEYWNGNIKWLSGGDIASNHKNFVVSSEKTITELGLRNSSAKLLPKFSTVISARGTVGKYCLLSEPMAYSQSNYGILPRYKDCFFFTYLLVAHSVDELQSAAYGSVFDTITTDTFKGISISLPKEENIIQFEESMKPFFFKILINQTQIRTLTALRDTLLPKLMSGEITVEL